MSVQVEMSASEEQQRQHRGRHVGLISFGDLVVFKPLSNQKTLGTFHDFWTNQVYVHEMSLAISPGVRADPPEWLLLLPLKFVECQGDNKWMALHNVECLCLGGNLRYDKLNYPLMVTVSWNDGRWTKVDFEADKREDDL